jgi:hypothetical protein
MRIGTHWEWAGVTVPGFLALLRQVTEAVGKRMELMLDGNQRLSETQALQVARALDEMGWTWFEEPIPQTDVEGYARLNAAAKIPITGGEQYTTVEQFEPYLAARAYASPGRRGWWLTRACARPPGLGGVVPAQLAQPDDHGQCPPGGIPAFPKVLEEYTQGLCSEAAIRPG